MAYRKILEWFWDGKITLGDCVARLDQLKIRGGFGDDASYLGYDYANQRWIEEAYPHD